MQYGKEPVQIQAARENICKRKEPLTFFHLTCVLGTEDDHFFLGKVDSNRCGRGHTSSVAIGRERPGVIDGVIRVEMDKLLSGWPDEHVAHKERMVGAGADHANIDPVLLIPSRKTVDDVDTIASVQVVDSTLSVDFPDLQYDQLA